MNREEAMYILGLKHGNPCFLKSQYNWNKYEESKKVLEIIENGE